jgi:hypothetical protein
MSFLKSPSCKLSLAACASLLGSSIPNRSAGAPPNNSAKGRTNPIVPPPPMHAGSFPNPLRRACLAASNVEPLVDHSSTNRAVSWLKGDVYRRAGISNSTCYLMCPSGMPRYRARSNIRSRQKRLRLARQCRDGVSTSYKASGTLGKSTSV